MEKIRLTNDGSNTFYSEKFQEHYHSTFGAINESMHVFIKAGLNYCNKNHVKIFELGFGTGLNTLLTYIESLKKGLSIHYTCIELYPINPDSAKQLNYCEHLGQDEHVFFEKLHSCNWNIEHKLTCNWNIEHKLTSNFSFTKINSDFNNYEFTETFDMVYFDAFSPETQPQLWSTSNFEKIYNSLNKGGILTTYCSKGIVKNNLRQAGFTVKRLDGPVGKRHILRAKKTI